MPTTRGLPLVLIGEITDVLVQYDGLHCVPSIAINEDGGVVLTVTVQSQPATADALSVLSLCNDLRYVVDVAQMRGLCERYGIQPEALERFLDQSHRGEAS